jgi:hypothetical protein
MRNILISILLVCLVQTTATDAQEIRGPAFTDPGVIWQKMPPGWITQPIQTEPEVSAAKLAVTLDQQLYAPLLPLIQRYATKHGVKIAVGEGTCGISAGLLRRKAVDIGGFCCPPALTDRLPGLRFHTLAIGAVALFVHPANPVENLSFQQAQRIFQGEISDWSHLGRAASKGRAQPIHVIGRLHCKLRPGHWRLLLDNEDLFSPDLFEVGTIQDMIEAVTNDRYAIGYETLRMIQHHRGAKGTKLLTIDGVRPDDRVALASGHYPLYRVYNVTSWEGAAAKSLARELVHYLQEQMVNLDMAYAMVPASQLRDYGWKFKEDELVGEPK